MNKPLTPAKLFTAALAKVESRSIRDWASSDHNRPLWLKIAKGWGQQERMGMDHITALSTYITATAIGL